MHQDKTAMGRDIWLSIISILMISHSTVMDNLPQQIHVDVKQEWEKHCPLREPAKQGPAVGPLVPININ